MTVNNGTTLPTPLEGYNKRKTAREIAEIAKGNCYSGNTYKWKVWNEEYVIVAAGEGIKTGNKIQSRNLTTLIGERV